MLGVFSSINICTSQENKIFNYFLESALWTESYYFILYCC